MKSQNFEYLNGNTKRRLDVLGGITITGLLAPAGMAAGVASQIDSRSFNPFFRQTRIGQNGETFNVTKFRTLPKKLEAEGVQTFGTFDPRASKLGLAIRESGIDEMPQIFNVLKGEMSLVGMRPLLPEDIERLEDLAPGLFKQWSEAYERYKPGLTGPSQIYRHHFKVSTDEVWQEAMRLDLEYVKNASLRTDLRILGGTPLKMLGAKVHMVDNSSTEAEVIEMPAAHYIAS